MALANQQWPFSGAALRGLRPGLADAEAMSHAFTTSERILEVMEDVTGEFAKLGRGTAQAGSARCCANRAALAADISAEGYSLATAHSKDAGDLRGAS